MLTGIKHPLVFVVLISADVMENFYCLLSLYLRLRGTRNKISPVQDHAEDENHTQLHSKSLTKRTSSVYKLLDNVEPDNKGTIFNKYFLYNRI